VSKLLKKQAGKAESCLIRCILCGGKVNFEWVRLKPSKNENPDLVVAGIHSGNGKLNFFAQGFRVIKCSEINVSDYFLFRNFFTKFVRIFEKKIIDQILVKTHNCSFRSKNL
jgi:hypothetical protein